MGEKLIAVTHGRGLFWIDLSQAVPIAATAPSTDLASPAAARDAAIPGPGVRTTVVPVSPSNTR